MKYVTTTILSSLILSCGGGAYKKNSTNLLFLQKVVGEGGKDRTGCSLFMSLIDTCPLLLVGE